MAVIALCELFIDFFTPDFSQLQNSFGAADIAVNNLFVQVLISPEVNLKTCLKNWQITLVSQT